MEVQKLKLKGKQSLLTQGIRENYGVLKLGLKTEMLFLLL